MININVNLPSGPGIRAYNLEINGHKFLFEVENDEQEGKRPIEILAEELSSIVQVIRSQEVQNKSSGIKLKDIIDDGHQNKTV